MTTLPTYLPNVHFIFFVWKELQRILEDLVTVTR